MGAIQTTNVELSSEGTNELPIKIKKMRRTLLGEVPVESPLYRFHPTTRLFSLFLLGVAPLFIDMPEVNMIWILLTILLMKYGKVDLKRLKIYLPVIFTVAIFMFSIAIIFPGEDPSYIPFEFLGITMYYQRIYWAFVSYVRIIALLFGSIQYFLINRETDMLVALQTLKVPFSVTYMVGLSIRGADMFMQDMRTIREAETARGLDESSLKLSDRAKLYAMYMIPLFTLAIRRADEISNALFVRGYTFSGKVLGGGKRSNLAVHMHHFEQYDLMMSILQGVIFVTIAFLNFRFNLFGIENSPINNYFLSILS
jgi:energy-coupling factor transporter transmembrane protein EcfT